MPSSRNGSVNSHTSGHSTKASRASGQQSTNSRHHSRKLNIADSLLRRRADGLQILVEELDHAAVGLDLVLLLREAVALIVEHQVIHRHAVLLDRGDDVIALGLDDARVVGALDDHQRLADLLGMEERRRGDQELAVLHRVADLLVERLAEALPVGRDALQRADPVGHTEDVDADLEGLGPEGQRGQHHIAAIAAADDADALGVDDAGAGQEGLGLDAIPQRLAAMLAVIGREEALAIARAAAVVDAQHRVAVVDEILHQGRVAAHRLAARAAMDPDDGRHLVAGRGFLGQHEDRGDDQAVEAAEADDGCIDQLLRVDLLGQALRQLPRRRRRADIGHEQVVGRTVTVHIEGHALAAAREPHATHLATGQLRQGHRLAIAVQAQRDAGVGIDARHAEAAVL
mmetsp:Transcript_61330/g.144966  ORF Transcript_61330/g.144966 Transcript_61330/m.144966 type:complete len:401 (+) Transcript_61330:1400-2602(+)